MHFDAHCPFSLLVFDDDIFSLSNFYFSFSLYLICITFSHFFHKKFSYSLLFGGISFNQLGRGASIENKKQSSYKCRRQVKVWVFREEAPSLPKPETLCVHALASRKKRQ